MARSPRLRLLLAAALALAASAGIGTAIARTHPEPAPRQALAPVPKRAQADPAIRIVAVGDFGVGGESQALIGDAIRSVDVARPIDLLVTLGDNDYSKGTRFANDWPSSFGWVARRGVAVAGVLGNHDYEFGDRGAYEFEALGMPARWYSRRVGNVEVFVLDSNDVGEEQTAWLDGALAASTARWKLALMHHPPFNCGSHGADIRTQAWVPLFEQHGVQLVLAGHEHNYQRFLPANGVSYVVHGGGGQRLYDLEPCPPGYPQLARGRRVFGFLELVFRGDQVVVTAWNRIGFRADRFELTLRAPISREAAPAPVPA